jgi:serine/threonine protein kinase
MAPEQLSAGKDVDQRADVYAFGLIFYDLLVGRRRIEQAASAISEFHGRIEKAPPPPRSIDPTIPEPLDDIITRCLQPDPDARYQTSAELEAALGRLDAAATRCQSSGCAQARGWPRSPRCADRGRGGWRRSARPAREPISVLVADFVNSTGDPEFDRTQRTLAMRWRASFISFPPANARKIAEQLSPAAAS